MSSEEVGPSAGAAVRYPVVLRLVHWGIALLIGGQLTLALVLHALQSLEYAQAVLWAHRQLGLMLLILAVARLALLRGRAPRPADIGPKWQARAASLVHAALGALLLLQPLVGLLQTWARGDKVSLLGLVPIPTLATMTSEQGVQLGRLHLACAMALVALIGVHIAAVVFNHLVRRAPVLERLLLRQWNSSVC